MSDRRLHGLVHDLVRWVECRRRTLRHIGNARTPEPPPLCIARTDQVHAVENDTTFDDPAARPRKSHGGKSQRRFASPRLPDEPEDLAAVQRQINAPDDLVPAIVAVPFDTKIFDLEKGFSLLAHALCARLTFHRAIRLSCAGTSPPRN